VLWVPLMVMLGLFASISHFLLDCFLGIVFCIFGFLVFARRSRASHKSFGARAYAPCGVCLDERGFRTLGNTTHVFRPLGRKPKKKGEFNGEEAR
jgi:hypothetical protein